VPGTQTAGEVSTQVKIKVEAAAEVLPKVPAITEEAATVAIITRMTSTIPKGVADMATITDIEEGKTL